MAAAPNLIPNSEADIKERLRALEVQVEGHAKAIEGFRSAMNRLFIGVILTLLATVGTLFTLLATRPAH
jgi:hypothetical protein